MKKWLMLFFGVVLAWSVAAFDPSQWTGVFAAAEQEYAKGHFAAVIPQYRKLLADLPEDPAGLPAGQCFLRLTGALAKLDRLDEWSGDYEKIWQKFGRSPDFLCSLAEARLPQTGYWEDEKLLRGTAPEGCPTVRTTEYDRHRLLQHFAGLLPVVEKSGDRKLQGRFYFHLARLLLRERTGGRMWMLENLTPLTADPPGSSDIGRGVPYRQIQLLQADGAILTFPVRRSWDEAKNDGERCRWALEKSIEADHPDAPWELVSWMHQLYGNTHAAGPLPDESLPSMLAEMPDNEIWLPGAGKRMRVPSDSHYLVLLQRFLTKMPQHAAGWRLLAEFRQERYQYPAAAAAYRQYLKLAPDDKAAQRAFEELTQPRLQLAERSLTTVPRKAVKLAFTYRNTKSVDYQLRRVDTEKILPLWITELLIPANARKTPVHDLSMAPARLLNDPEWQAAVGAPLLQKRLTLKPDPKLFPVDGTFSLPPLDSGIYLFTADTGNGGPPEAMLLFVLKYSLLCRAGSEYESLFLVDTENGKPVAGHPVTIYRTLVETARNPAEVQVYGGRQRITVQERIIRTDSNGQGVLPFDEEGDSKLYAVIRDDAGGLAVMPHHSRRTTQSHDDRELKAFVITDAPVYRPGQQLELECYIRRTGGGAADPETDLSNAGYSVELYSSRGELFSTLNVVTSDFATFRGQFRLPESAPLGTWMGTVLDADKRHCGNFFFKVEEYRKPEFTVTVETPAQPVRLGMRAEATLAARYYFGAPVAHAPVQYRIYRQSHSPPEPRVSPWDWLFGAGFLSPRSTMPEMPEMETLVRQGKGVTDGSGNLRISIDTAPDVRRFGKQDAAYRIEAEVTDSAHRRQSGSGKIPIAAVPFRVYSWLNGNFFEPGERIVLNVKAQRMDGQPVAGRGETRIYRLRLENGQETRSYDPLHVIHFDTTSENAVKELPFEIRVPGIYIAVTTIRTVKRENSESIARIRVRSVRGGAPVFSSRQLEMLTDRELYRPGDDIKLLFSSRQRSGNVLCFIRSTGGGGGEYRVVPLENHSGTLTFRTSDADSPNLFVDAAMFADGRWHLVSREIPVPPARNMLLVQLKTVPEKLSPGDSGKILLQLQDDTGGPTGGDVTVAVYDQAIEDFSGGSNIPGIMDFFWGWKRYHFPQWMHLHDGTGGPRSMMMQPVVLARNGVALAESADNMPMATVAGSGTAGEPVMRQRFADRLLWVARSRVDDSGKLELPFVLPDNLTRWRVRIWAMAPGCRAGEGTADFTVSQPFVARLATPVSLNAGDRFEIKGVLHNLTDREQQVNLQCLASPVKAVGADVPLEITVPAHGTTEIAREVIAERPGSIRVSLRAGNDAVGDGISQDLTVHPPGIRQFYTAAGTLAPDGESLSFPVVLPENVDPATVSLMLNTAPSLTGAMLEVLPLLTSQKSDIFSRIGNFLPTVMAWQACEKAGIKDCDLTLPPAVPLSPNFDRQKKTVSGATLNRESFKNMTREHLQMIAALQNSDGGWGWFSGATERSWPDTTAATVQALAALKDFPEISGSLQRGIEWLRRDAEKRFKKLQQQPDAVPADVDAVRVEALADAGAPKPALADWLYQRRGKLPVLSLLRLARAARQWPEMQKEAAELQKLLKQYVVYDNVAKRHRLAFPVDRFRDPVLAAALYIRLLAGSDPQSPLLPDLARQLVEAWRYAPEENSARSAGEGVRALADWIAVSGEKLEPREIEILLDGKTIRRIQVPVEKMATFDPRTLITPQQLMPGPHEITIRQQGKGFLYCHMAMAFDNRDDTIPSAGRELIVSRKLFLLTPDTGMTFAFDDAGHPVSAEAARWTRSEIAPGTVIPSGAMLEEELTVEAVADCNYVRIRAPRPAGFYPLGAQSGWLPDNPLPVYGEFHPSYTDLYCHRVRRGKNVVRTRMVAETPGYYRWPAAEVMALQVPVLRGNSASSAVEIQAK